jgi:hypothetical protein
MTGMDDQRRSKELEESNYLKDSQGRKNKIRRKKAKP